MAYSDIIQQEEFESNYLAVLNPRRHIEGWTLFSGTTYVVDFTYGYVSRVESDGTPLTRASSTSLSDNQFYYDSSAQKLYAKINPNTPATTYMTVTSEVYIGTVDVEFHRVPTDSATDLVYFDRLIKSAPDLKATISDVLFGFLPVQTSQIELSNHEHFFDEVVYNASFSQTPINLYHWVGDVLDVANMRLVMSGLTGDIDYDDERVNFKLFDRIDLLKKQFSMRNSSNQKTTYNTAQFPFIDPAYVGKTKRYLYGIVDGFIPAAISHDASAPAAFRRFGCIYTTALTAFELTTTLAASPAPSSTLTFLSSVIGFSIGDSIKLTYASGAIGYAKITNINYGGPYIIHTDSGVSGAALTGGAGSECKRGFVSSVVIYQNGIRYDAMYSRDYVAQSVGTGVYGFTFQVGAATNLGMAPFDGNEKILCRVYGPKNAVTLNGSAFGTDNAETGVLSHGIVILLDLLKKAGVDDADIDSTSFTAALSSIPDNISFAIPANSASDFPTYRDLVSNILQTLLLRLYINNDNKWAISQVAPFGANDRSIDATDIKEKSWKYSLSYSEVLSEIFVEYNYRQGADDDSGSSEIVSVVSSESENALYLHKISKQKTYRSLHRDSNLAQTMADRLMYALGERKGTVTLSTGKQSTEALIAEVATISRPGMPGFAYNETTYNSRNFAVTETSKTLDSVDLVLDDQKGIQDNSGSW